jgi:hypothetical protein
MDPEQVEKLIQQAVEYARLSVDQLILDERVERVDDDAENGEFVNLIAELSAVEPQDFTWANNHFSLMTHFLFPNLSLEERKIIEKRAAVSSVAHLSNYRRQAFEEACREINTFESKLTAAQMAILEAKPFNQASTL